MSEWKEYKLGDIINLKRGYDLPNSKREKGVYPIYSSSGITDYHVDFMKEAPGVITGRYGTIGEVFYSNTQYWPLNTTLYVQDFKENNPKFIYYFLKNFDFEKYSDKSAVPGINRNDVHQEPVLIPDLSQQRTIAEVLTSLDDKIDLLQRQNKTLEQLAETLFRQWFVEGADKSWKEGNINSIASTIQYGYTQSASEENVGPKFLRITDIQGGVINWDAVPYCKVNEKEFQKYKLKTGDIVVARTGASTGENIYLHKPEESVFASYLIRLQFSNPCLARFIGLLMRSQEYRGYIEGILSGSAQPNANASELTSFQLLIPPVEKLELFYEMITELDEKKYNNNNQIKILTQLRDALLPKLMSGEVRVKL